MDMDEKPLTRDEIALRILERESTNVWTWANVPKEKLIAYCFDTADQFMAEASKRNVTKE